jgi:ABC-type glycerol-3-phosphate transport system substrate-binding protein
MAEEKSVRSTKISRRELLRLTALTGLGLVAAQCAPAATQAPQATEAAKAPEAPTAAPPPAEKVNLRFVVMEYDEKMKPDTQALVDAFNQSQDQIEVSLDVYAWADGYATLVTQISGGQAPDVCNVSAGWQGAWVGINEVLPLDDLLPQDFLANFVPSGLNAFTIKGQLLGMPYFLDPRAMYYRKDLFESEGLNPPKTWDDVVAAGQALHKPPDMNGYGMAFTWGPDSLDYWWYPWFGVNGADANLSIWTEDGHSRLGSDEAIQATQFVVDLAQKYKITNADYSTAGRDAELQPLFYAGKLAMLITGSWFPTLLKNNAPDLAYGTEMPPVAKADLKPATGFWPDCVILFKQTEHPQEAAAFLQFIFNKENRLAFAKQRGVIPERIDVGADPAYAVSDVEKFFVKALETAHNVYETPWPGTYDKTMQETEVLIGRAAAGEITAEEAMKQAAEFTDKENGLA